MTNTKLIRVLMTLNTHEWSSFRKYLLMYTRKGSDNFDFFEYLQLRKDRLSNIVDADEVRIKHFPHLTSKGFSNLLSRLFNWLEDWLSINAFKKQKYQSEIMLIQTYNQRGLYKLANSHALSLEKTIHKDIELDLEKEKALSSLYHAQFYSDNPIKYQDVNLYNKLIKSYCKRITEQLAMYQIGMLNWGQLKKIDFSDDINYIKDILSKGGNYEIVETFELVVNVIDKQDEESLNAVFTILKNNKIAKQSELHMLLIVFCIQYAIYGWMNKTLHNKNLIGDLYIYALENRVFESNGKIPKLRFSSIVMSLSVIKGYTWTNKLIDDYIHLVQCINTGDTLKLSKAKNSFQNKRYEEIIPLISSIQGEDTSQKIDILILQILAIYKSKNIDYEILKNRIHNFKRFLKRSNKSISTNTYNSYFNCADLINQMSQSKFNNKQIDLNKYKQLVYRSWFTAELKTHGK